MKRNRLLPHSFALCAAMAIWSPIARAGDTTLAETLFREGKALLEAHDYAHACPKLAESFRQDPGTGTLLALAMCQEQNGQLASAWASYSDVATRAKAEGRSDREQLARERGSAVESRLSRLTVSIPPSVESLPGLVVKRDGTLLPQAAWGSAIPMDAGEHVIEVTATGKKPWKQSVALAPEKDQKTVLVTALEDSSGSTTTPAAATTTEPEHGSSAEMQEDQASNSKGGPPLRPIGLAVGGVGAVGLVVGSVFGLKAKGLDDDSKANGHCDSNGCDKTGSGLRDDALSAARLSTIFFIGGAVLVATGVTLYVVGGSNEEKPVTSISISPSVASSGAGLLFQGGF